MVELELDVIRDFDNGEELQCEQDQSNCEALKVQKCCHCGIDICQGQEVYDSDICTHYMCLACRFKLCKLCNTNTGQNHTTETGATESGDLPFVKYPTRKIYNTDHIVDVEVTTTEGIFQKKMCTVCKGIFKKTNARYHYACASGDKPFSCVECSQKFMKKSHMESHLNSHYGIRPFKCSVKHCKASFFQKDKLTRHMKTHDKGVKHTCTVCQKPYTSLEILNIHMAKMHSSLSSLKPFRCEMCPRSYKYKRSLKVHRLKHQALKEYMCEVCGKKYPLFTQLKHHKRSHVLYHRRPYLCKCGRRFMTRHNIARHELIHTTCNDFECSLCNTTFGRKDNLERHMKNFHQANPTMFDKSTKLTATVAPSKKNPSDEKIKTMPIKKIKKKDVLKKSEKTPVSSVKNKNVCDKLKNSRNGEKTHNIDNKQSAENKTECTVIIGTQEKTKLDHTTSVIVSAKPTENHTRPSVIKPVPKLLPYRVLPPDKRFLKMSEEMLKSKTNSELMPPPVLKLDTKSKSVQNRKIPKDDALNRCFRIIRHTNSVRLDQPPTNKNYSDNNNKSDDNVTLSVNKSSTVFESLGNTNYTEQIVFLSSQNSSSMAEKVSQFQENEYINSDPDHQLIEHLDVLDSDTVSGIGGPTLPSSLPDNMCDVIQEDNFTNSYAPLNGSSTSPYTPYFDNECFRENVSNYYEGNVEYLLHNDLDIGFQYISEELGCAEMNFSSENRISRCVSQETNVIRESFR